MCGPKREGAALTFRVEEPAVEPFDWRGLLTSRAWPWVCLIAIGGTAYFWSGLISLGEAWARPEYSYGPLVPLITGYLALREIHRQPLRPDAGSRLPGFALFVVAMLVGLVGNLASIPDVITYGFILFVGAVILLIAGTREGFRFWPAWLHLIFMLPLPQFIYLTVSVELQQISSQIGVELIQLASIPVFLEGNIIDLGVYKLQVAEACSGLRYLFPLFSFGWLITVLYRGPNWHRVVIFLSTVPITILMNSFRIGVIGVLVNEFGIAQAEGFLHVFEGWVIFIACTAILYLEAMILWRFFTFGAPRPAHVLEIDFEGVLRPLRRIPGVPANALLVASSVLVLVLGAAWQLQPQTTDPKVIRSEFASFPMEVGGWHGRTGVLDEDTRRVLGADDFVLADYDVQNEDVNLLMTFYRSQTGASGIHSPEVCIPSAGWEVSRWEQSTVDLSDGNGTALLPVNRAVIQKGLDRQLVYYWFEQRGKRTTSDYEVKFLSVLDEITSGRSDGGLVRLVTPIGAGEPIEQAAERLNAFARKLVPMLPSYYPPN
jgi:exosortase D (VPLPA-CTERM-specific)